MSKITIPWLILHLCVFLFLLSLFSYLFFFLFSCSFPFSYLIIHFLGCFCNFPLFSFLFCITFYFHQPLGTFPLCFTSFIVYYIFWLGFYSYTFFFIISYSFLVSCSCFTDALFHLLVVSDNIKFFFCLKRYFFLSVSFFFWTSICFDPFILRFS